MAQNSNHEELKQQARCALAEGREEISTEVHRMRQQLSPGRALQRVVTRHTGVALALAVTAGIIPALLIFRSKRSPQPLMISVAKPQAKPVLTALLLGSLGVLARAVTPALVKSTLMPQVLDFIAKKRPGAATDKPQV